MVYPLKAPNGWSLLVMERQYIKVIYKDGRSMMFPYGECPWYVEFQEHSSELLRGVVVDL